MAEDKQLSFSKQLSEPLEKENFPTIQNEDIVDTIRMEAFDCSIDEFLNEIPDPLTEFSSPNYSRTGYEENAEIYLNSRYKGLDSEIVKYELHLNKYNLTKVTDELEAKGFVASPYCLDKVKLHHSPSIMFHQEVWFIEHKTEVMEFLLKAVNDAQLQINEYVKELFECMICSEDVTEYSELGSCDSPNGHLFCKTCIQRSLEIRIGEGSTTFPCLAKCGGFFDLQTIKEVLPVQSFTILMNKIQEEEVRSANIPGVETCPFCHYAYGPGEEVLFTCLNPACMKISCRACKKEEHSSKVCPVFQNENEESARHFVENRMSEALMRQCYKCGKNFIKYNGCNKITCACGATMCYLCRQPVNDYKHFNGPGGNNFNRCELYSDELTIHEKPVAASAREALKQLIANNPGLDLDPVKIIPK